ncbi:hypothetical protein CK203_019711 [Vitis vinifera]|uniref:Uncharacterized protein n=1 Tax=Vitis vinifera TaxID=29760 RepID=A0A438JQY9_VITVI|nr:hypothetical protein CK203_019711 [Vitis vinifera]
MGSEKADYDNSGINGRVMCEAIRVGSSQGSGDGYGTIGVCSGRAGPEEQNWRMCHRITTCGRLVQPPAFSNVGRAQQ